MLANLRATVLSVVAASEPLLMRELVERVCLSLGREDAGRDIADMVRALISTGRLRLLPGLQITRRVRKRSAYDPSLLSLKVPMPDRPIWTCPKCGDSRPDREASIHLYLCLGANYA